MPRVTKDKRKVLVVKRRRLKREACSVFQDDAGSGYDGSWSGYDGSWSGGTDASCCSSSDDSLWAEEAAATEEAMSPKIPRSTSMQKLLHALKEQSHEESRASCLCEDILFTELH
jgi:hypothetical protein